MDWETAVQKKLNCDIVSLHSIGGGDFAQSFKALLSDGRNVFVKTHQNPPAYFFETEAKGLAWLRDSGHVHVPEVLGVSNAPPFLVLEWIDIGAVQGKSEAVFGRQLAQLHKSEFTCFGRPDGHTTGSLAVPNQASDSWADFYANQRLRPLAKLAQDKNALPHSCVGMIEAIADKLVEYGAADEPPRLLHGDLWAGNRVVDVQGNSWLIDPAAHGGHREFDLAMMQLFGGYGSDCFAAYAQMFPLEHDWQSRVALHQLAPLIVHSIKFGGHYASATQNALSKYV